MQLLAKRERQNLSGELSWMSTAAAVTGSSVYLLLFTFTLCPEMKTNLSYEVFLSLTIHQKHRDGSTRIGKLNLADLAGILSPSSRHSWFK